MTGAGLGARRSALGLLDHLRARSSASLVGAVVVGGVGSAAVVWWRPGWWIAGLVLVAIGAAGVVGLAHGELGRLREQAGPSIWRARLFLALRAYAALVGLLAALAGVLAAVGAILGGGWV